MRSLLAVLLVLTTVLTGCDSARDTVDGVREQVDETLQTFRWCSAAFRLGTAVAQRDVEAAAAAAEDLQADAPEELQDELAVLLDAVARAQQGAVADAFTPEARAAGETVLETARARCDPTTDPTA